MKSALTRAMLGCLLLPAIAGCGATGLAWVDQPLIAETEPESGSAEVSAPVRQSASSVTAAADTPTGENHQRLNRTVTLGEVYQASAAPAEPGAPGNGGVTVTINNYTQGAPAYGGYASYGAYGHTRSSAGNSRVGASGAGARSGSSVLQPGQNWPTVADHGTNYPYRSAPASPWSRAQ